MKNIPFSQYSKYYDLLYQGKDYNEEAAYILDILKIYVSPNAKLLEFGSGTGKHGAIFAKKGYNVTGIEKSKSMLENSISTDNFEIIEGDILKISIGTDFDAVLALFHVLSYQISNESIISAFKSAASHMTKDGIFIFDVWYTPAVHHQKPSIRIKRLENDEIKLIRIAEPTIFPNENRVDVNYLILVEQKNTQKLHTINETHPMRHFSIPEIEILLTLCGFQLEIAEEFLTKNKPSLDTWGICFVARKL